MDLNDKIWKVVASRKLMTNSTAKFTTASHQYNFGSLSKVMA